MSYWIAGGNLSEGKQSFSAITLQDGTVLIVGGWLNTSVPTTRCERSTTDGSSWSITGSLANATTYARLVLLSNGTVLAIGGSGNNGAGNSQPFVSLYDPITGTWTAKAPMSHPRYGHGCWLLSNGKVLVAGGWDSNLGSTTSTSEIYDPTLDSWTSTGSLNQARFFGGDNLSGSGKPVYIAGASTNTSALNSIEVYNIGSGTWATSSASLPVGFGTNSPGGTCSISLNDGTILWVGCDINAAILSGGMAASNKTGVFDADADTFTAKGNLDLRTADQAMFKLPNGMVMIAGGFGGLDTDPTTDKVQIYDPTVGTWTDSVSLPLSQIPEAWKAPVLLHGSSPFILGADASTGNLPNTYIFKDGSPPLMAIIQVQKKGTDTGGTSHTATLSSLTTTGNFIAVLVAMDSNLNNSVTAVHDNDGGGSGNTYTHLAVNGSATNGTSFSNSEIWYTTNIIGGTAATITVTTNSAANNCFVEVIEYSGVASSSPVETSGTISNNSGGNPFSGPALTIANGNDLLLAVAAGVGGYPSAVAGPWTAIANDDVPADKPVAQLIGPGAGTYTPSWTMTAGADASSGVAFKPTSGIAFVNGGTLNSKTQGATTDTVPLGGTSTTGNLLIILVATFGGVPGVTSIIDNVGNNFTLVPGSAITRSTTSPIHTEIWYKENSTGGATSATITWTSNLSAGVEAFFREFSGAATSGSLQTANTISAGSAAAVGPSITPPAAGKLLVCIQQNEDFNYTGVDSPWGGFASASGGCQMGYQINPALSAQACVFSPHTATGTTGYVSSAAEFSPPSTGVPAKKKASTNLVF